MTSFEWLKPDDLLIILLSNRGKETTNYEVELCVMCRRDHACIHALRRGSVVGLNAVIKRSTVMRLGARALIKPRMIDGSIISFAFIDMVKVESKH